MSKKSIILLTGGVIAIIAIIAFLFFNNPTRMLIGAWMNPDPNNKQLYHFDKDGTFQIYKWAGRYDGGGYYDECCNRDCNNCSGEWTISGDILKIYTWYSEDTESYLITDLTDSKLCLDGGNEVCWDKLSDKKFNIMIRNTNNIFEGDEGDTDRYYDYGSP
tara:strand:- start:104 stop:586 length:483 start_codon:yes stop_codon:yes gene_type:complete